MLFELDPISSEEIDFLNGLNHPGRQISPTELHRLEFTLSRHFLLVVFSVFDSGMPVIVDPSDYESYYREGYLQDRLERRFYRRLLVMDDKHVQHKHFTRLHDFLRSFVRDQRYHSILLKACDLS